MTSNGLDSCNVETSAQKPEPQSSSLKRHKGSCCGAVLRKNPAPHLWTFDMYSNIHPNLGSRMSRVEELPGDVKDSLNISDTVPETLSTVNKKPHPSPEAPFPIPPKLSEDGSTTPSLPPAMDSVRSHTADEIVQMMNQTPLFMTSLENAEDDGTRPSCAHGNPVTD